MTYAIQHLIPGNQTRYNPGFDMALHHQLISRPIMKYPLMCFAKYVKANLFKTADTCMFSSCEPHTGTCTLALYGLKPHMLTQVYSNPHCDTYSATVTEL